MADRQTLNKKHHDNNSNNRSRPNAFLLDGGKKKTKDKQ
jgi:hypothetical protein